MNLEKVVAVMKKPAAVALIVVAAAQFGTKSSAATPATMTIYNKKASAPRVFTLSSVKNVTFGNTAVGKLKPAARVMHSMNVLSSSAGLRFGLSGEPGTSARFKIYDLQGRQVFSREFLFGNNGNGRMSVLGIATGLYLAQLKNGASSITHRITFDK